MVPGASECGDNPSIAGGCVGVLSDPICSTDACTDGVKCSQIVTAASDAALQMAASSATAGACIVVSPGKYGSIELAGGVSILGRAASAVVLGDVHLAFGSQAATLLRGITVKSVRADGHGSVTMDRVLVDAASAIGVEAQEVDLTLTQSTIASPSSVGVVVDCRDVCPPGVRPKLVIERSWIHDARRVAALAFAVDAIIHETVIQRTHPESFLYGRGIEVSTGGTLQAFRVRIEDSDEAGLMVHGSAALLGPELEIKNAMRGIWLAEIPDGGVVLDGFTVADSAVTGLGFDKGALNIVVRNGTIHATRSMNVPVDVGGTKSVGDGITWGADAHAKVESSVRVGKSERLPALIDATAHGTFAAVLDDGDADKGVFLKNGMTHPDLAIGDGIKVTYGEPPSPASAGKTPKP
ncbi:MAG: hypothetical protein ACXVCJ_05645 [Polyangiales bacterium]